MDPNATIRLLNEAVEDRDLATAAELIDALVTWLGNGGFDPEWSELNRETMVWLLHRAL
jgi:hypothetical protein